MRRLLPYGFRVMVLAAFLFIGSTTPARAQGFISPYIGFDFGGDSGCLNVTNCENKKLNAGVAFGAMGTVLGFEEELGYAKNFFGTAPGLDSSVLTLMSNLMLAPQIGPVRPYFLGGIGLIKTHVSLTPSSVLTYDNNNAGWDLGGGLIVLLGSHLGVRGDIRYFHAFQDLNVLGFTIGDTTLDFGRASGALVLKF